MHGTINKLICALEASKFSGLGMISQEIWTENANLGSIIQLSLDVHLCVQTSSLTAKFGIKQTCKHANMTNIDGMFQHQMETIANCM